MTLPHCTWDKFGELLAENGGRLLGLFDELMAFFATMNMYSSHKMQSSGKAKTRETGISLTTVLKFFTATQTYITNHNRKNGLFQKEQNLNIK